MEQLIHRLCFVIDKFCRFDKHSSCPRMYSYGEYPEVYEMMMRSYGTKLFLSPNRKKGFVSPTPTFSVFYNAKTILMQIIHNLRCLSSIFFCLRRRESARHHRSFSLFWNQHFNILRLESKTRTLFVHTLDKIALFLFFVVLKTEKIIFRQRASYYVLVV